MTNQLIFRPQHLAGAVAPDDITALVQGALEDG
jgi:hypothetical protein